MTQTTEQLAPDAIAGLIPTLTKLTTEQPTTVELEEALKTSKAVTRAIFEWLAARYSAKAQSEAALNPGLQALRTTAAEFAGIPVETAVEREDLDRIERACPVIFNLPLAQ